jgi:hypothetical protein
VPIEDGLLIAVKDGVVELTANVVDAARDRAETFLHRVNEILFDHQYQAMTDPAIMNPPDLGLASCLVSRDPLPDALKDGLLSLGFVPVESEAGGRADRSLFARFQKRSRSKLDKWRTPYLRASDVSKRLGELEESLIDEVPEGSFEEIAEDASRAVANAARTILRLLVAPNMEGLQQLERAIVQERSSAKGRLVLHPKAVRGLTAFAGETVRLLAPASRWDDEEGPLLVDSGRGAPVATDPEFRAVKFIVRGNKELLTGYVESVVSQSRGG